MNLSDLQFDRNLRKKASQTDQTKGTAFISNNPIVNTQNNSTTKTDSGRDATQSGAKELNTGTVITAAIIQTSATPSRVQMAGNDITFFDDTYSKDGEIVGDTSRLIFTHGSGRKGDIITSGFIMEKRASTHDTYDNVLSFYSINDIPGKMDYLFLGTDGRHRELHTNYVEIAINHDSTASSNPPGNGAFVVSVAEDGVAILAPLIQVAYNSVFGIPGDGWSTFITARNAGFVVIGADVMPNDVGIDIGSPSNKFGTFYGATAACSLPTVPNALELLDLIPEPTDIGDRGHFGEGIYFDDQTFPDEISFINSEGAKDIEITRVVGFLLKAVKELSAEVKDLKTQLNK